MTNMIITPILILLFFCLRKYYRPKKYPAYVKEVNTLFRDMNTPVNFDWEIGKKMTIVNNKPLLLGFSHWSMVSSYCY